MEPTQLADNVKRPVPTLTRQNWREWFEDFKYWMVGEKIYLVITKTLTEYATKPVTPPPTSTDTSSQDGKKEEDNKGFAAMKDALEEIILLGLDEAKQEKY
jgi:hypothetical protein